MPTLKYWNAQLKIGLADFKNVYQFPQQEKLIVEVHQGRLYYRMRGSSKRVSYVQIKKGLQKKQIILKEEPLPF